jgi:hypothetical protein
MLPVMLADFVDGDDVRVLKAGGGFGLGAKTLHERIAGETAEQQHLHRDDSVQGKLPGAIDDAHATAGDFVQEFIVAEAAWVSGQERSAVLLLGALRDNWFAPSGSPALRFRENRGLGCSLRAEEREAHADEAPGAQAFRRGARNGRAASVTDCRRFGLCFTHGFTLVLT